MHPGDPSPGRGGSSKSTEPIPPTCDGCRDCGRFFLDVVGAFRRRDVRVTWTNRRRATTEKVDRLVDQAWAKTVETARRTDVKLYDGKLCRLIDYTVADETLHLVTGPVSFREFVGTNYAHSHLVHTAGPEVLANPLGVSAAVLSGDGFIILGRRSDRVARHAGMIHPIGGIVELNRVGRPPHPFDAMSAELREETGLVPPPGGLVCLGLVRDKSLLQPELVFRVETVARVRDIRASARRAVGGDEHEELLSVRDRPASVVDFIEKHGAQTTPVALATLLLHGLNRWGCGWFTAARGYLRKIL